MGGVHTAGMRPSDDFDAGPVTSFGLANTPAEVMRSGARGSALGAAILALFGLGGVLLLLTSSDPALAWIPAVLLLGGLAWMGSAVRKWLRYRRMRRRA